MAKYVINIMNQQQNVATSKAKDDVASFLYEKGYKTISLPKFNGRIQKLLKTKSTIHSNFNNLKSGDLFLLQYPTYLGYRFEQKLIDYLKKRGVILVALIHDIDSLRYPDNPRQPSIDREIIELNRMDCVITSNNVMDSFLKDHGLYVPTVILGIFDYKHSEEINRKLVFTPKVVFAGNLNKAEFIFNYPENGVEFDAFGTIIDEAKLPSKVKYFGSYPATKIMNEFDGGFGLVWDGKSSNHIDGLFGDYLAYNNPHKLSLFLSSGLPVVIWRGAALANFVEQNKVGILVDSLLELPEIFANISNIEYENMANNAQGIAYKLVNGEYIKAAITQAESIVVK